MKVVWMLVGEIAGLLGGSLCDFGVALTIATPRQDGTFAMREMLLCVPLGAVLGLFAGLVLTMRLGGGTS